MLYRDPVFRETLRYTLQGAALFVLFSYVLHDRGRVTALLSSAPARRVGLYSYTLYLSHYFLLLLVQQWAPSLHPLPQAGLAFSLAFFYSAAMYAWVERPAARLRRRLHRTDREATVVEVSDASPSSPIAAGAVQAGGEGSR